MDRTHRFGLCRIWKCSRSASGAVVGDSCRGDSISVRTGAGAQGSGVRGAVVMTRRRCVPAAGARCRGRPGAGWSARDAVAFRRRDGDHHAAASLIPPLKLPADRAGGEGSVHGPGRGLAPDVDVLRHQAPPPNRRMTLSRCWIRPGRTPCQHGRLSRGYGAQLHRPRCGRPHGHRWPT